MLVDLIEHHYAKVTCIAFSLNYEGYLGGIIMPKYSKEDIKTMCQEQNVKYIRMQFTDILGIIKNVELPISQLEKALDNKMMFDGSSIEGFVRIEESDMYLYPDL